MFESSSPTFQPGKCTRFICALSYDSCTHHSPEKIEQSASIFRILFGVQRAGWPLAIKYARQQDIQIDYLHVAKRTKGKLKRDNSELY
ncbi:hypothetical protein CEXT_685371 [Caerostris extrusa]|uniref:Uncharacterized protein n=1 Tax=Caerostris extrusa TaxID=172846 RepID=A0AAV4Y5M1_CAEEX|nr:hypothetical protein CEXT_685371 [Caerostris extrusa]